MLNSLMTSRPLVLAVRLLSNHGKNINFLVMATSMTLTVRFVKSTRHSYVNLNDVEIDKIKKLCSAADSDENSFWKLLKGQRSSSQMSAFLVDGKLITEKTLFLKCGRIILKP